MRTVIFISALIIAKAIKQAHGVDTPADRDLQSAIAVIFVVFIIADVVDFVRNIKRN